MPEPAIRIAPGGVAIEGDQGWQAEEFAGTGVLRLPGFLDVDFLALLDRIGAQAGFVRETIAGIGSREVEAPLRRTTALLLALRSRQVVDWARRVTSVAGIEDVGGSVVRSVADSGDQLVWHDDRGDRRRAAALTIRLGGDAYLGGVFEFRAKNTPDDVRRFDHAEAGDALLFAVSPAFEHRVTPLVSGGPRCMFTGWFLTAAAS